MFFGVDTSTFPQGALGIATFRLDEETGLYSATSGGSLAQFSATDPSRIDPTMIDFAFVSFETELSALRFVSSIQSGIQASVLEFSGVESATRAQSAIDILEANLDALSLARSNVGAAESRLEAAYGVLAASRENMLGAESRIRDVDVASEVADLTRESILQESAVSALRLVNESQGLILDLLAF